MDPEIVVEDVYEEKVEVAQEAEHIVRRSFARPSAEVPMEDQ